MFALLAVLAATNAAEAVDWGRCREKAFQFADAGDYLQAYGQLHEMPCYEPLLRAELLLRLNRPERARDVLEHAITSAKPRDARQMLAMALDLPAKMDPIGDAASARARRPRLATRFVRVASPATPDKLVPSGRSPRVVERQQN